MLEGVYIALVGMGVVLGALTLLALVITALGRLFPESPKVEAQVPGQAPAEESELKVVAAIVAALKVAEEPRESYEARATGRGNAWGRAARQQIMGSRDLGGRSWRRPSG